MESLKVHKRSRVEGHLQILQILLVLLVLLDLVEETLSEFLWFLLDLFELLKGRILKSFLLKLIWFFKRMISNFFVAKTLKAQLESVSVLTFQENGF